MNTKLRFVVFGAVIAITGTIATEVIKAHLEQTLQGLHDQQGQIALEKTRSFESIERSLTIMQHADGVAALAHGGGAANSHFQAEQMWQAAFDAYTSVQQTQDDTYRITIADAQGRVRGCKLAVYESIRAFNFAKDATTTNIAFLKGLQDHLKDDEGCASARLTLASAEVTSQISSVQGWIHFWSIVAVVSQVSGIFVALLKDVVTGT